MPNQTHHASPLNTSNCGIKLNLCLHVTGQRDDGYHTLSSITVFCPDIGDHITYHPHESLRADELKLSGPFAYQLSDCAAADNLVVKALALLRHYKTDLPFFSVTLQKNVPIASGIGGGSCDAAFIIRHVAADYNIDLSGPAIQQALLRLGADMPVCVGGYPAVMSGVGEIIEPLTVFPDLSVVTVNPMQPLSARDIYAAYHHDEAIAASSNIYSNAVPSCPIVADAAIWADFLLGLQNDLQKPAEQQCPVIGNIIASLTETEAMLLSRMSGSGATCFALFASHEMALNAAVAMSQVYPDYWIGAGRVLPIA